MKNHTLGISYSQLTIFFAFFLLAPFLRAQTNAEVDNPSLEDTKTETSVAVRLWKDATHADDGNTMVAGFIDNSSVATSVTTNGGTSWTQQTTIPYQSAVSSPDGLDDEKLAYRLDGSGNPELVSVFRCFDYDGVEGTFVNFSSDDGNSWETAIVVESQPSWTDATRTTRPFLAADNNSGSSYRNNVYVTWTKRGSGTSDSVYVARIVGGIQTLSGTTALAAGTSTTTVDACDVAVARSGNIYVLWMVTHTNVTPNTRDFYLSESTNGGASWPAIGVSYPSALTYTILTGSPRPSKEFDYQDYPCLAISGCSAQSAFVAFTQAPSDTTDNPSDLFWTSSPLSTLTTWSAPVNVNADKVGHPSHANNDKFSFQFEPAIASDGLGGAYITYYSQQDNGTSIYRDAMICETGTNVPNPLLNPQTNQAYLYDVTDYIAMVWNPSLAKAFPVWTDYPSSNGIQEILSTGISSPDQGVTAYCNQRKVVGDGTYRYLTYAQSNSATNQVIWFKQSSISGMNDVVGTPKSWSDPNYYYFAPSI
ncbi:MAG: hypothetical protein ACRDF4_03935, partial [Rhabdochlamydiaceae bacterium]